MLYSLNCVLQNILPHLLTVETQSEELRNETPPGLLPAPFKGTLPTYITVKRRTLALLQFLYMMPDDLL